MSGVVAEFPECFKFLFQPSRYKAIYGGRGSGKSVSAARALLIQGAQEPLRILCARELQTSIRDSVHKLLSDEIEALGLAEFYEVQSAGIFGKNGTEFIFKGLRHNVSEVKSMQGIDRCWIEEAQVVSKSSYDVLIPTIRKDNSEIWLTFNPELDTDETYKRFVLEPPKGAIVRKVNWSDNPFFPSVLRDEMEHLKERDHDSYLTVWLGHCRQTLDGAIYAREIREATAQCRITKVPYDPTKPVHTFFDLGFSDSTSIWFAQTVAFETRIIDHISDSQKPLAFYQKAIQSKPYVLGTCYLPHDARAKQLGTGRSIEELMRAAGFKTIIVPQLSVADGINATRTMFPTFWFDEVNCADGLQSLRRYRYDVDKDTGQLSRQPLHDAASHDADALRYLAVALKEPKKPDARPKPRVVTMPSATSWMG